MPDLAGSIGSSVIELVVEYQSATDACTYGQPYDIASAFRGSAPPFAERCAVGVVVECRRKIHTTRYLIPQRKVPPSEIRRHDHDAAGTIERSRRSNADAEEIGALRSRLGARLRDDLLDERGDAVHDGIGSLVRLCLRHAHGNLARAVNRHCSGGDVRPAEIDPDDELLS